MKCEGLPAKQKFAIVFYPAPSSNMASINRSLKRKACSSYIPGSIFSFVMGALRENFIPLKNHIVRDCPFVASKENPNLYAKQLLEELFRYLYLLADSSSDGVVRSSPSYFVDQAFHCLLLDPVLYWKVCDEILNMQGKIADELKVRVLPHDVLGGVGDDEKPRKVRYFDTLDQYKETFGEDPPLAIWSDYSNDPAAVQAVLVAQQAQSASVHHPHLRVDEATATYDATKDIVLIDEGLTSADIKCPYTAQQLVEPMRNPGGPQMPKCIHRVSRIALDTMCRKVTSARCPIGGCMGKWSKSTAVLDEEFERKIQRYLQKKSVDQAAAGGAARSSSALAR
eukprot:gene11970-13884_t